MLDQKLISDFTKAVAANSKVEATPDLYGSVVIDTSGNKFVKIDGSTINTPIASTLDVKNGDRVLVTIENHTAKVASNLTTPASGYQATDLYKESVVEGHTELSGKVVDLIQESADGKTKNYYTATEPTGGNYVVGDTWFDTSKGYAMSNWNGTAWVPYVLGPQAIGKLIAANIDAGAITADKIDINDLETKIESVGDPNGSHIIISGENIVLKYGTTILGYISQDKFYAQNIEPASSLMISNYTFKQANDGNLVLYKR